VKKVILGLIGFVLTVFAALPAQAQIAPEAGYWWDSSASGSGFVIEIQGTTMFMAGFLYSASGEATWVASTGPMTTSSQYSGSLITYDNGQTLTGAYQAPSLEPALGNISITFTSNTAGTIVWPGRTIPIQRFNIVPNGVTTQQPATNPQTGWWWNASESGRGFAVEVQNGIMYFAGYMYDANGNPIWYLSTGPMTSNVYSGMLTQYANGQTLTGPYQVPSEINQNVGSMTLQFTDTADAIFTLPGGRQIPLTRFQFGSSTPPTVGNVVPLIVDAGPSVNGQPVGDANVPFVTVTICAAGTSNCQTIDHIDVDTGSSGLRIISSVLSPSLALTQQNGEFGGAIGECTQFAIGYLWGSVKLADITIGGETARSVPIQIIGDPNFSTVPSDCSGTGPPQDTVALFMANGLIGVGNFQTDCGPACVQAPNQSPPPGTYYSCQAGECVSAFVPLTQQVQNPVGLFPVDNNGVQLQLPSVGANGALTATGSLIFGIGTQSNNGLGSARVLVVDPNTGYLNATISGVTYESSFVDSGSSAFFLPQSFAAACTDPSVQGYFCPPGTVGFTGTVQSYNNTNSTSISFSVANALNLLENEPNFTAFNDLGAVNGIVNSIDLGLPFFFGRSVFSAIEGKSTPGGVGPFVAF
jgi:hypothetical protein